MPDQKSRTIGQPIELREARLEMATAEMEGLSGIASDACEAMDLTVVAPDLEVDGETARRKCNGISGGLIAVTDIGRTG